MAVAIVLSASPLVTINIISTDNPATIASNIANKFAEATPAQLHVLIATGLALFALTFAVNFAARGIVGRADKRLAG
jgi:phosphate transport system permease protein